MPRKSPETTKNVSGADWHEERHERGGDDLHEEPDSRGRGSRHERNGRSLVKIEFSSVQFQFQFQFLVSVQFSFFFFFFCHFSSVQSQLKLFNFFWVIFPIQISFNFSRRDSPPPQQPT